MKDTIEKSIKNLADRVKGDVPSPDALRFTQAVLNLAHALNAIKRSEQNE